MRVQDQFCSSEKSVGSISEIGGSSVAIAAYNRYRIPSISLDLLIEQLMNTEILKTPDVR